MYADLLDAAGTLLGTEFLARNQLIASGVLLWCFAITIGGRRVSDQLNAKTLHCAVSDKDRPKRQRIMCQCTDPPT